MYFKSVYVDSKIKNITLKHIIRYENIYHRLTLHKVQKKELIMIIKQ